mmetsp:Transcript_27781/g.65288  ORF Transcript_27781/g.65288 Transcript_27781/m.65288 type:complete len:309 (+) Transcript_27781:1765-2691(+)
MGAVLRGHLHLHDADRCHLEAAIARGFRNGDIAHGRSRRVLRENRRRAVRTQHPVVHLGGERDRPEPQITRKGEGHRRSVGVGPSRGIDEDRRPTGRRLLQRPDQRVRVVGRGGAVAEELRHTEAHDVAARVREASRRQTGHRVVQLRPERLRPREDRARRRRGHHEDRRAGLRAAERFAGVRQARSEHVRPGPGVDRWPHGRQRREAIADGGGDLPPVRLERPRRSRGDPPAARRCSPGAVSAADGTRVEGTGRPARVRRFRAATAVDGQHPGAKPEKGTPLEEPAVAEQLPGHEKRPVLREAEPNR